MGRDKRETLLKEYETCQSHNNALGNQSWISISILITVNLLVLGQVAYNFILTSDPVKGYANLILVSSLGFAMIIILLIFKRWDKRVDFHIRLNHERMRDIEKELDFEVWKNWRVRGLDLLYKLRRLESQRGKKNEYQAIKRKWEDLNDNLKAMIEKLSLRYPQKEMKDKEYELKYESPTTEGEFWKLRWKFSCIFPMLMALWGIVIVLEALTYCPAVYQWLLN